MTRVEEYRLPDLGEGLTEAEVVSWAVAVGDTVELNQVIGEVETAKAVVELPSPFAGVVRELLAQPGDTLPVGAGLIRIEATEAAGENKSTAAAGEVKDTKADRESKGTEAAGEVESAEADGEQKTGAVLVGYGPSGPPTSRRRRRAQSPPQQSPPKQSRQQPSRARPGLAVPAARRVARELGIDLSTVTGTGRDGAITVDDVTHARRGPEPEPAAAPADGERETRTPVRSVRRQTASAMVSSAFTAPHVSEFLTVDVTETVQVLHRLRASKLFEGLRLTPLTLVAKALLLTLREHPTLNSTWAEDTQEIVTKHYVNLGIATATDRGLMVPNIKDANQLTLPDLCRAIGELTDTARAGKATPADLTGGTITITNVGVYGIDTGTPILNPGEAAILALGAINRRPWVVGDEIVARDVTTLSVTVDHRLVDGEQASKFLSDLGAMLADPVPALLAQL
ncbi:dihydrolipoamide acetyltransferase family protein [Rhodococcus spongiicola]|uniref:Dihydrolipoamide acetyltransferase component of pyruvate dehydrogenase complex n=1 Tax=Rhodococcus spongiicola TaxID=2487352 RepID=A0A3S3BQA1_9NOCA|nr:dihydrolipoamide acetyltransferase family protein [Rhodococcus spongiicola]RVW06696.1 2-oxo acid dehydrogenase subunit E2 [Rhodococcus spongiicola]